MGLKIDSVPSDATLPARADVVIIGGGIIGAMTALCLAERGIRTVVLEKGAIGGEQSSRNWGWCRQANRDPREFALIRESLRLWNTLDARVGADTGFTTTGIAFAAHDEATEAGYAKWVQQAADSGIESRLVRGAELARLLPGDTSAPRAALYCESDGRAEPQRATAAIARAAQRAGALVFGWCAARGIETAGGRVVSCVTERGTIASPSVVVAGGAWSRRILRDVGIDLPQLKVRASVARTAPMSGAPEVAFWDDAFAFRKRADGGYTIANGHASVVPVTPDGIRLFAEFLPAMMLNWRAIRPRLDRRFATEWREAKRIPLDRPSPYEASRVLDPEPDLRYLDIAFKKLRRRFPAFAGARIVQSWAGFIDSTPDIVPVISAAQEVPGLIVATGFSGHGFGIAPGAGQLVADLVCGTPPLVDPHHFRLARYRDGSSPGPTSGI
jgi:glycine/D-amino acid oxidase-like deaminating enzyme